MTARWTISDDIYLAKYYSKTLEWNIEQDLLKMPGTAARRVKRLQKCGAWDHLKALVADEYKHIHAVYSALGRHRDAELLSMTHPGSPIDWIEGDKEP